MSFSWALIWINAVFRSSLYSISSSTCFLLRWLLKNSLWTRVFRPWFIKSDQKVPLFWILLLKFLCIFPKKNRLNVFLYIKPWTVSEMLRTNENKCWWCCFLLRETGYESYFHSSKTLTEILQSSAYGIASMLFFYQSNDWLCRYVMSAVKYKFTRQDTNFSNLNVYKNTT